MLQYQNNREDIRRISYIRSPTPLNSCEGQYIEFTSKIISQEWSHLRGKYLLHLYRESRWEVITSVKVSFKAINSWHDNFWPLSTAELICAAFYEWSIEVLCYFWFPVSFLALPPVPADVAADVEYLCWVGSVSLCLLSWLCPPVGAIWIVLLAKVFLFLLQPWFKSSLTKSCHVSGWGSWCFKIDPTVSSASVYL